MENKIENTYVLEPKEDERLFHDNEIDFVHLKLLQ
jgi:hypothetical protein